MKIIDFKNFTLWDTKTYFSTKKIESKYNFVDISSFLKSVKKEVKKEDVIKKELKIISKINFGGELFLRNFEEINTYKGNLFLVKSENLIFSKINARHGCIYFHTKNFDFAVSSEYPAFEIDKTKVIGNYLTMVLRSNYFKIYLKSKATGHSKARVNANDFLFMQIPLPPLSLQNELVSEYENKMQQAQEAEQKAQALEKHIETYLLEALGIEMETEKQPETDSKYKFLKFVELKEVSRWDVDFLQGNSGEIDSKKFETKKISNLCKIGSGGTPSRTRSDYFGGNIPWIKTGEVREVEIFDSEEKITKSGLENSSAKIFPKGSLILAMYGATAGRTAKLGIDATTNQACAVLHNIDNTQVNTNFLWLYLQSQVENFKRISAGSAQPNLNAQKVANYKIPLPPLSIQNEIVLHIEAQKAEIKRLKSEAERLRQEAKAGLEREIFN